MARNFWLELLSSRSVTNLSTNPKPPQLITPRRPPSKAPSLSDPPDSAAHSYDFQTVENPVTPLTVLAHAPHTQTPHTGKSRPHGCPRAHRCCQRQVIFCIQKAASLQASVEWIRATTLCMKACAYVLLQSTSGLHRFVYRRKIFALFRVFSLRSFWFVKRTAFYKLWMHRQTSLL